MSECPFCGSRLVGVENVESGWCAVVCRGCGAHGPTGRGHTTDEGAELEWERRKELEAERDRLHHAAMVWKDAARRFRTELRMENKGPIARRAALREAADIVSRSRSVNEAFVALERLIDIEETTNE